MEESQNNESVRDIIDRMRSEGTLLRNTGANSIKSLKDLEITQNVQVLDVMNSLVDVVNRQTSVLKSILNVNEKATGLEAERYADEARNNRVSRRGGLRGLLPRGRNNEDTSTSSNSGSGGGGLGGLFSSMLGAALGSVSFAGLGKLLFKGGAAALLAGPIGNFVGDAITASLEGFEFSDDISASIGDSIGKATEWGLIGLIFGKKIALLFAVGSFFDDYIQAAIDPDGDGLIDAFGKEWSAENVSAILSVLTTAFGFMAVKRTLLGFLGRAGAGAAAGAAGAAGAGAQRGGFFKRLLGLGGQPGAAGTGAGSPAPGAGRTGMFGRMFGGLAGRGLGGGLLKAGGFLVRGLGFTNPVGLAINAGLLGYSAVNYFRERAERANAEAAARNEGLSELGIDPADSVSNLDVSGGNTSSIGQLAPGINNAQSAAVASGAEFGSAANIDNQGSAIEDAIEAGDGDRVRELIEAGATKIMAENYIGLVRGRIMALLANISEADNPLDPEVVAKTQQALGLINALKDTGYTNLDVLHNEAVSAITGNRDIYAGYTLPELRDLVNEETQDTGQREETMRVIEQVRGLELGNITPPDQKPDIVTPSSIAPAIPTPREETTIEPTIEPAQTSEKTVRLFGRDYTREELEEAERNGTVKRSIANAYLRNFDKLSRNRDEVEMKQESVDVSRSTSPNQTNVMQIQQAAVSPQSTGSGGSSTVIGRVGGITKGGDSVNSNVIINVTQFASNSIDPASII